MKLNHIISVSAAAAASVLLAACADDFDPTYKVDKPEETSQYEYLNSYGTLKSYINYSNAGPIFRLGGALDAEELAKKGLVYALAASNYDEVTFGNHMKYNFCVAEDGSMDFSRVRAGIEAAEQAGLKVFGHTLCWHSQQQYKYLMGLIADKKVETGGGEVVVTPLIDDADADNGPCDNVISSENGAQVTAPVETAPDGTKAYKVHIDANPAEAWSTQLFLKLNSGLEAGAALKVKFRYYCTDERSIETQAHGNPGNYHHWSCIGTLKAKPEWQTLEFTGNVGAEWVDDSENFITIAFNLSSTPDAADFYIDDVEISTEKAPAASVMLSVIDGEAIADQGECAYLISREPGQGDKQAAIVDNPFGSGKVYKAEIGANPAEAWDSQFFIKSSQALEEGAKIHVKFDYACTDERSIDTQAHGNPGSYHHYQCIGTLKTKTEWQTLDFTGTVSADWAKDGGFISIAFNLSSAPEAATFYINNVVFEVESQADEIPLTPAEKDEILSAELKRWIYGMMEACEGKVTAWDVVNEAIADGHPYGVKHFEGSEEKQEFYWQNYLGDNFARKAVKYAREGFAEYGGNPDELLLFVNDYNLEAAYNNTAKTDGLIRTIAEWEADGVTRIDGIGTQMHVTYHMNPTTQARQEQCVVDMFTKLAASGKLIHVSELDMGIADENGNTIKTPDLTFEQKQLMSDYYKFIVKKFFEIVPAEQRYGIVQWAATDSPEGSGWRAGEPIGIWDINHSRKPAYAGWCDALKEATNP